MNAFRLEKEQAIRMLQKMVTIRQFEENVARLFAEGKIPGFVHTYIGEEACAVGICLNLRNEDYIMSTHRGHGHYIAKGGDMKVLMAEIMGRATGCCKGKGGSMHFSYMKKNIVFSTGIVGSGIPIAVGIGLALKMKGTDNVVTCFFGDGASNQGVFHEGINQAAIWSLPVIFVCENNLYATTTHISKSLSINDIADRATAYGIPGVSVDGNDLMAVCKAGSEAIERAREGRGPTLMECKTYRFRGHYEGDPQVYRTKEEVENWRKKCPIIRFKNNLLERGIIDNEDLKKMEREVSEEIDLAVKFALDSPWPKPEYAMENLYA